MNKKNIIIIIVIIVLLLSSLLIMQILDKDVFEEKEEQQQQFQEVFEVELEIFSETIEPAVFMAEQGQTVDLTIVMMEEPSCLFSFEDANLSWIGGIFREAGQSLEITFTSPREGGEYHFYCTEEEYPKTREGVMIVK